MKIAIVHNAYGKLSGEETVVAAQLDLLKRQGHTICQFNRSSAEIAGSSLGALKGFFTGIHNISAVRRFKLFLEKENPDVVHIHNLFPLISPAILPVCTEAGIPVVMTVHNYRLVCPNGLHMPKGSAEICETCCGGHELNCFTQNCEGSRLKSLGYALRNWYARKRRFYLDHVSLFACLTDFQKQRLVAEGYPEERIAVIPNMPPDSQTLVAMPTEADKMDYVGYVGRISPEKGIDLLFEAAAGCPEIPFRLAGGGHYEIAAEQSDNVRLLGALPKESMGGFYNNARFIILTSRCFEGFPMSIVEAMCAGRAVIAPSIGGLSEIVDEGVTGLLFEPGDSKDLAGKIQYLWDRPELCSQMGDAGRAKVSREYSEERYYDRLIRSYSRVINAHD